MTFRQFIGLMVAIGFACVLVIISDFASTQNNENNAVKNIENLCRWQWNRFRNYKTMTHSGYINQNDLLYNYSWHNPGLAYNSAVVEAKPKRKSLSSFIGVALVPAGNQASYVCQICKSNNSNVTLNTSTMISGRTINCPRDYHFHSQG